MSAVCSCSVQVFLYPEKRSCQMCADGMPIKAIAAQQPYQQGVVMTSLALSGRVRCADHSAGQMTTLSALAQASGLSYTTAYRSIDLLIARVRSCGANALRRERACRCTRPRRCCAGGRVMRGMSGGGAKLISALRPTPTNHRRQKLRVQSVGFRFVVALGKKRPQPRHLLVILPERITHEVPCQIDDLSRTGQEASRQSMGFDPGDRTL